MDTWLYAILGWIVSLVVGLILFLIFREFILWYWKVNRIVELLEENNRLLTIGMRVEVTSDEVERQQVVAREVQRAAPHAPVGKELCPECGKTNPGGRDRCQWCRKLMHPESAGA